MENPTAAPGYEETLNYIYSFHRSACPRTNVPDAMLGIVAAMGMIEVLGYPVIQITGTNGKGSTARVVEAFLRQIGREVICLTSPHVLSVCDRIRVNGIALSRSDFVRLINRAAPSLDAVRGTLNQPSPMQILTVLAILLHYELGPGAVGIYEVGKCGRYDSTNLFAGHIVGISRITEDHIEECGGSFIAMVDEKLDLCRRASSVVSVGQVPCVEKQLIAIAQQYGSNLHWVGERERNCARMIIARSRVEEPWQLENAALAISAFQMLGNNVDEILETQIQPPPRRWEKRLVDNTTFILDAAHNVDGLTRLLDVIRSHVIVRSQTAIVGLTGSRDWRFLWKLIAGSGLFCEILLAASSRPRCVPPEVLAAYATESTPQVTARAYMNLAGALEDVLLRGITDCYIFGSFALVSDFDRALHTIGRGMYAADLGQLDPIQPWMVKL